MTQGPSAACQNCGAELQGAWCHLCGQKDVDLSRQPWTLAADLMEDIFDLEGRLLRTLRDFLLRPGLLSRVWSEGRRQHYSSPVRVYVVLAALSFLLIGQVGESFLESMPLEVKERLVTMEDQVLLFDFSSPQSNLKLSVSLQETGWVSADTAAYLVGQKLEVVASLLLLRGLESAQLAFALFIPLQASLLMLLIRGTPWLSHVIFSMHSGAMSLALFSATVALMSTPMTAVALLMGALYGHLSLKRMYGLTHGRAARLTALVGSLSAIWIFLVVVSSMVLSVAA